MPLHEPGEEVAGARVVGIRGGVHVIAELADDRLVIAQEIREHLLGRRILARVLLETRGVAELGQRRRRRPAERPRALGHVVDHFVELAVLALEELVQVVELRPDDVPVVVAGLGVEQVLVGQQGVQDRDDLLALALRDADVRTHRFLPLLGCRGTADGFIRPPC